MPELSVTHIKIMGERGDSKFDFLLRFQVWFQGRFHVKFEFWFQLQF